MHINVSTVNFIDIFILYSRNKRILEHLNSIHFLPKLHTIVECTLFLYFKRIIMSLFSQLSLNVIQICITFFTLCFSWHSKFLPRNYFPLILKTYFRIFFSDFCGHQNLSILVYLKISDIIFEL